jgi:hypothetical protein
MSICLGLIVVFLFTPGGRNFIPILMVILIFADVISAGCSIIYAGTVTNGTPIYTVGGCLDKDYLHTGSNGGINLTEFPCEHPKTNPFEEQPMHPVQWIISASWFGINLVKNAVHITVT